MKKVYFAFTYEDTTYSESVKELIREELKKEILVVEEIGGLVMVPRGISKIEVFDKSN